MGCEGDCDFDWDCKGDLTCYQRGILVKTLPPGCKVKQFGKDHDFCFDPTKDGSNALMPVDAAKAPSIGFMNNDHDDEEEDDDDDDEEEENKFNSARSPSNGIIDGVHCNNPVTVDDEEDGSGFDLSKIGNLLNNGDDDEEGADEDDEEEDNKIKTWFKNLKNRFGNSASARAPSTAVINGVHCNNPVTVDDIGCNPRAPDHDGEGDVCRYDGLWNESYCSYGIGPRVCAFCKDSTFSALPFDFGKHLNKGDDDEEDGSGFDLRKIGKLLNNGDDDEEGADEDDEEEDNKIKTWFKNLKNRF